ncbi:MAG: ATP-dependent zinc metalloprotease FtsH, partial [Metamycoplasmataceae bacterium]
EGAQKVAYKIIKENMTLLELIKTSLLENETIVSEEIEYIAEHLKLPEKRVKPKKTKAKKMDLDELINEVDADENHHEEAHHVNEVYDADEKDIDQMEDDENREIKEKKNS